MNYNEDDGGFKLLPDECNIIRSTLKQEWEKQRHYMDIISDSITVEYRRNMQRTRLDSYSLFKRCLLDLSCIADTLRKFGIDKKLEAAESSIFMRIYADVIHTVTGWNEYKTTFPHCLNIITFDHEQYIRWKDHNIKVWAFERGVDQDSEVTQQHLNNDY